jgi:hypothetical protein
MGRIYFRFSQREAIAMARTHLTEMRWILPSLAQDPGALRGANQTVSWSSDKPALSQAFARVFEERDDVDLTVEGAAASLCETVPIRASSPTPTTHILSMAREWFTRSILTTEVSGTRLPSSRIARGRCF